MTTFVRRLLTLASAAAALAGLAGCTVGQPKPIGRDGIDGLIIPTPTPYESDFVDSIDNPWLPLTPGATWKLSTAPGVRPRMQLQMKVLSSQRPVVDGIRATVVETRLSGAGEASSLPRVERLAQDRNGNVWVLGEGSAGLAMPALPRLGDGWVRAQLPDGEQETMRIVAPPTTLPSGVPQEAVLIEMAQRTLPKGATRPGSATTDGTEAPALVYFAKGLGPVHVVLPDGSQLQRSEPSSE